MASQVHDKAVPGKELKPAVPESSVHLDAVRGAAALVVLLGHTRDLFFTSITGVPAVAPVATAHATGVAQSHISNGNEAAMVFSIGNEAVMVFFVLSGYLVGGSVLKSLWRDNWSWSSYLIKRLTRLWVVLLPALTLGAMVDWVGLRMLSAPGSLYMGPAAQSLVHDVAGRLTIPILLGNSVFLQAILIPTAGTNDSLWSLSYEFWYYIAFPLAMLALLSAMPVWKRLVTLALVLAIGAMVGPRTALLFSIWALGALLSVLPRRLSPGQARILSWFLVILLPIYFVLVRRAPLPVLAAEWLIALYFAFTMYVLLHKTGPAKDGLYRSISGFFSRISYSMYLVHLPVAVFLAALINNPWHQWPKSPVNICIYLAMNGVLIAVSYVFYRVFEANTDAVRHVIERRIGARQST